MIKFEKAGKLRESLHSSSEWKKLKTVKGFERTIYLFRQNEDEILTLIEWGETYENAIFLWDAYNRERLKDYTSEFIRLLHNYVSSSSTLVDHARKLYVKNYKDDEHFGEYDQLIDKFFAKNVNHLFIKRLRNYMLHSGLPTLVSKLDINESGFHHYTALEPKALLSNFDEWGSSVKKWLEELDGSVIVKDELIKYKRTQDEFYSWLFSTLSKVHAQDRKKVHKCQVEINSLLFEHHLDVLPDKRDGIEEAIFLSFVQKDLVDEIMQKVPDPLNRARLLIKAAEEEIVISEEYKQKIISLVSSEYKTRDSGTPP